MKMERCSSAGGLAVVYKRMVDDNQLLIITRKFGVDGVDYEVNLNWRVKPGSADAHLISEINSAIVLVNAGLSRDLTQNPRACWDNTNTEAERTELFADVSKGSWYTRPFLFCKSILKQKLGH